VHTQHNITNLAGHGVGKAGVVAPVTSAHGHKVHLGVDDASADGGGNLLGSLDTEADVALEKSEWVSE
jgi:hypothetical protein